MIYLYVKQHLMVLEQRYYLLDKEEELVVLYDDIYVKGCWVDISWYGYYYNRILSMVMVEYRIKYI